MDLPSGNDIASYKRFLDTFCEEITNFIIQDDNLPIRIVSYYLREEEIEGECLGWSQQYLLANGCPESLCLFICSSVFVEVSKCDVRLFYDEGEVEKKEEEEEKNEDGNKSEVNSIEIKPFLDMRKLLKEVINTVHKICQQWKTQLPHLHMNQSPHEVSVHAIKNIRRKMEDVHVICSDLNALFNLKDSPSHSYYAIFDGHGGLDAALYAASHLHTNLVHHPNFLADPVTALKHAYKQTDEGFLIKAKKENLKSGTTGISVLKQDSQIHIAWLGDSQAVLVRNGETVGVMNPHKPDRADEKERIQKLGGIVVWFGTWRVNGSIAVARAIGDKAHKPYICSDADVFSVDLDGTEDYVVLGCDGVWDVIAPRDIPEIVYNHVQENHGNRSKTAHRIVHFAKENGSSDNISVIVVFLRNEISVPQDNMHVDFCNSAANNIYVREQESGDKSMSENNSKQTGDKSENIKLQQGEEKTNQSNNRTHFSSNILIRSEKLLTKGNVDHINLSNCLKVNVDSCAAVIQSESNESTIIRNNREA